MTTVENSATCYRFSPSCGAHIQHLVYLSPCFKCPISGFLLLTLLDYCMDVLLCSVFSMVLELESDR